MAAEGYMDAWRLYRAYQNAADFLADRWTEYETEYTKAFERPRGFGLGFTAAGGILQIASPFIPGEKRSLGAGLFPKILYSAGHLLLLGGQFFSQFSVSALAEAERKYILYEEASVNRDAILADYQEAEDVYKRNRYLAYGLWGLGTASIVTALFLPPLRAAEVSHDLPVVWEVVPASFGWGAEIRIHMR